MIWKWRQSSMYLKILFHTFIGLQLKWPNVEIRCIFIDVINIALRQIACRFFYTLRLRVSLAWNPVKKICCAIKKREKYVRISVGPTWKSVWCDAPLLLSHMNWCPNIQLIRRLKSTLFSIYTRCSIVEQFYWAASRRYRIMLGRGE